MPSESHRRKVIAIQNFFNKKYVTDNKWFTSVDHEGDEKILPPVIGGYRPDFYATRRSPYTIVIGEAKSAGDFSEGQRSQKQVSAFISCLADWQKHPEQSHITTLILCVALSDISLAKQFISSAKRANEISIDLIDETGFEYHHAYR